MANNKIIYGNQTLVDLTGVTATESDVLSGYTFHKANGSKVTGTMMPTEVTISGTKISVPGSTYTIDWATATDEEKAYAVELYKQGYINIFDYYTVPTWTNGADKDIVEALNFHYQGLIDITEYWNENDVRQFTLKDGGVVEYKLNNTTYDLSTPTSYRTTTAFRLQPTYIRYFSERGQWAWVGSTIRNFCNNTYLNYFPDSIKGIFKQFYSPQNADDYFYIPKSNIGILRNQVGTGVKYWIAPASDYVREDGVTIGTMNPNNSYGVFPYGAI